MSGPPSNFSSPEVVGRFAPSPTGPLHFGSLVAALGSCLEARRQGGRWLVRMEDVDRPRCPPGMDGMVLRCLAAHGFAWDGEVLVQSQRTARYREVLAELITAGDAFGCACTRADLASAPRAADGAALYPGTCRHGLPAGARARAWRLRVGGAPIVFDDAFQGRQMQDLAREAGDFVLKRADGYFAYQLAVVADDADQGITHVVRGADLLASTPRQIFLQQRLGLATPHYAHLPVAMNARGEKLSKQTGAPPLDEGNPRPALAAALAFLGQQPPEDLAACSLDDLWRWALQHWRPEAVPAHAAIVAP